MHLKICLLLPLLALATQADRITLRGGARVQAPVIQQGDTAVILDLGHDLLRIPREQILAIHSDEASVPAEEPVDPTRLYREQEPAPLSTRDAARLYAPSVVLVKTAGGLGSGFFVNDQGYLITNFHVIAGEKHITVTQFLQEGRILRRIVHKDVEIVATAPFHDLAVLKIAESDTPITPVVFAPQEDMGIGETVFAIGNPLGLERTVTEGVLSQTHRNFGGILYLQVDASINPGNSGGPLFNARGQVIGIINMGASQMEGLNFAIPARHAKYILDHIDAFTFDASNPESGYVYPDAPRRTTQAPTKPQETDPHDN